MEKIRIDEKEKGRRIEGSRGMLKALGVKHASLSRDVERVWRASVRSIQKAVLRDDDMAVEAALLLLQARAVDIFRSGLAFAVDMAYDYLESEEEYEDSGRETDRRSLRFWMPALLLYIDHLRREVAWFRSEAFPRGELMLFLNSPLIYLAERDISSAPFRRTVNVGQGRRYQVRKDFTKDLLYAMTSALFDTLQEEYRRRGVVAYVGFRNGDYPCDLCDEYEGRLMPIEDMVYPLHVNCICGFYELYADEVLSI